AQILTHVAGWPAAEEMAELSPGEPALAVLALLGKDRSKVIAVVGHQPGLGHLLAACLLGGGGSLPIEMKKNAVACVSFTGSPRAGHAALAWLATPRMLRALR
ncbi:MAG: phosphohistidine phosphatase, partial [Gammaproteobacteria bacterium]|nr:phosphohistidine phosphatase [Gammaproteobacteria bacterium]